MSLTWEKIVKQFKKEFKGWIEPPKPKEFNKPQCPRCGSPNIFIDKKGYSTSTGCCGLIALGPVGLLCGQTGAKKVQKNCLDCRKTF